MKSAVAKAWREVAKPGDLPDDEFSGGFDQTKLGQTLLLSEDVTDRHSDSIN
jgi:hypothetical protein